MAKINEGPGSGSKNPLSNEYKIDTELFKDDIDDMRGRTFGIEVVRGPYQNIRLAKKTHSIGIQKLTSVPTRGPSIIRNLMLSKKRRKIQV